MAPSDQIRSNDASAKSMSNIEALTGVTCARTPAALARSVSSSRNRWPRSTATIHPLVARARSMVCAPGPHPTSRIRGCSGIPRTRPSARSVAAVEPGACRGRPSVISRKMLIATAILPVGRGGTQTPGRSGARLVGGKADANVVGGPFAGAIAEPGTQQFANLVDKIRALAVRQRRHEALRKRLKPSVDFGRQRRRAGNQRDVPDREAAACEPRGIILDGREIPRVERVAVDAAAPERLEQCAVDRLDTAVATELADEAAAGPQRTPYAGDHVVGGFHPVDSGVAEDGVELGGEIEPLATGDAGVETEPATGFDLGRARIDADHRASQLGQLQRERAVAASEVEDALAGARREQLDYRRTEVGDEAGVARVCVGVPALGGSWHVLNYS